MEVIISYLNPVPMHLTDESTSFNWEKRFSSALAFAEQRRDGLYVMLPKQRTVANFSMPLPRLFGDSSWSVTLRQLEGSTIVTLYVDVTTDQDLLPSSSFLLPLSEAKPTIHFAVISGTVMVGTQSVAAVNNLSSMTFNLSITSIGPSQSYISVRTEAVQALIFDHGAEAGVITAAACAESFSNLSGIVLEASSLTCARAFASVNFNVNSAFDRDVILPFSLSMPNPALGIAHLQFVTGSPNTQINITIDTTDEANYVVLSRLTVNTDVDTFTVIVRLEEVWQLHFGMNGSVCVRTSTLPSSATCARTGADIVSLLGFVFSLQGTSSKSASLAT